MQDLEWRVRSEKLEFIAIGAKDHPPGSLEASLSRLARLQGLAALRFTIQAVCRTTEMLGRDGPSAIRSVGINYLLVDQTEPIGGALAEHLQLPYATICNALLLHEESDVPPPFTSWPYRNPSPWLRLRNWTGYRMSERVTRPVLEVVNKWRSVWNLNSYRRGQESYSKTLQISQQPREFDFPRRQLPANFHYVGPLRREGGYEAPPFPWTRLNGKPLIYASLGTLQNRKSQLFGQFCEACASLPVQLIVSHANGLSEKEISNFAGNPIVVPYAPQLKILAQAQLTLTHAGLNTVLDSLSEGVPLVAIPLTYEQPAIASRVKWTGVGEVLPPASVSIEQLKRKINEVLGSKQYERNADRIKNQISGSGGVHSAANLIESTHGLA